MTAERVPFMMTTIRRDAILMPAHTGQDSIYAADSGGRTERFL